MEKLSKRETIYKVITPNNAKTAGKGLLFERRQQDKRILKTIKKTRRNDEVEEEPSGEKKLKEPALNPTDTYKYRLNRHNHRWKNCPKNPNSKSYNGTHYSKIREQERVGMTASRNFVRLKSKDKRKSIANVLSKTTTTRVDREWPRLSTSTSKTSYRWIGPPISSINTQKQIYQRTRRATTILRPTLESS